MKPLRIAPLVLAMLAVGGCGGGSGSPTSAAAANTVSPSTSASLSPSPTLPPAPKTAAAIIQALRAAGAPIDGVIIYDASTDPNHLLGRPRGYESKGAWRDRRIPASAHSGSTLGDVEVGGGLEVFGTHEKAVQRAVYINSFGTQLGDGYDYACGGVLLRLSTDLTPTQAAGYQRLLGRVLRVDCSAVT